MKDRGKLPDPMERSERYLEHLRLVRPLTTRRAPHLEDTGLSLNISLDKKISDKEDISTDFGVLVTGWAAE